MKEEYRIKLAFETLCSDKVLLRLNAQKENIYSLAIPMMILGDEEPKLIWIDEKSNPLLIKINEMIEYRINQIKSFYELELNEIKWKKQFSYFRTIGKKC